MLSTNVPDYYNSYLEFNYCLTLLIRSCASKCAELLAYFLNFLLNQILLLLASETIHAVIF